jgi:PEP-CTERM motif
MKLKPLAIALLAATMATGASAAIRTIYDSARFAPVDGGGGDIELFGFGRGASSFGVAAASFATGASRVNFFDTWNIDVSGIAPGTYSFDNWLIEAQGSLLFGNNGFSVGLNYIDESGVRFTEFFDVNAEGTQAVGSGTFTVRQQCPIQSCVWLDIMGTQEAGGAAGYGGAGSLVASVVPEPASWGLMALGLLAVGAVARRRRVDA